MKKEEVYSWRVSTETKAALERAARRRGKSVADLLQDLVASWLQTADVDRGDEDEQRRLHQAAGVWLGKLRGQDPFRSERARETLRARLKQRRHAS